MLMGYGASTHQISLWAGGSTRGLLVESNGIVSFDVGPKFPNGSPADGKVWTATDGNGTGNWESLPAAGVSEVDVMVFSILFG